jgi:hypothetical protein
MLLRLQQELLRVGANVFEESWNCPLKSVMGCILAFVRHPAQIAQLTSAGGKGDALVRAKPKPRRLECSGAPSAFLFVSCQDSSGAEKRLILLL